MTGETTKAVFLSYASQDAEAAKRIADALRTAGIEVWFDAEGGLEHGDEWDRKIRRQIKECVLFIAVISANTQAREEGYFRIEWELAAQRALGIAAGVAFILPVVIDGTREADALVPDRFRAVQWTKLPGGVVPPEILQRFLKLWSHRTGALKQAATDRELETGRPRPAGGALAQPGWKVYAGLAAVCLAIAAGAIAWLSRKTSPAPVPPTVPAQAATPQTEAQKLVARMQEIYDKGDDSSNDEWTLAEELGERATKLEPVNAEAWAIYANVLSMPYIFGFDLSPERLARVTKAAERAMTLAPASTAARLALVNCRRLQGPVMTAEADTIIRQLLVAEPDNWHVLRMAGNIFRTGEKYDEAIAYYDRAAAASGNRPFAIHGKCRTFMITGRFAEAEAILDQLMARNASPVAAVRKIGFQLYMHDDLDAAEALLAQVSPVFLSREEGAEYASTLWLWRRNADQCVAALARFSGDTLRRIPKGLIAGGAYHAAGRESAARVEWQTALQKIEQGLAATPNDPDRLYHKAMLLALLGRTSEAEKLRETCEQLRPLGKYAKGSLLLCLGRPDEALDLFEASTGESLSPLVATRRLGDFRHDPVFDPLRARPRFQAMIAQLAAKTPLLRPAAPAEAKADAKSVAVLAFENLSDDRANEYFSDGISEELLNVLAKVPGLKVTARTSSFHFKGKDTSILEIARQLGVAYVVEGSVRKAGEKVRITAQLIKAADGFHLWSETFTRDLKDVFAVQDEIAGLIAKNLELKMDGAARAAVTIDPEAYRLYLEGRQILQRRTVESYAQAEKLFMQARALAPEWAPLYAGLADAARLRSFSTDGMTGPNSPWLPDMKAAKALAERALELDPSLAEAYVSLAGTNMLAWNFPEGERLIQRALELNPNQADAYLVLGRLQSAEGRLDESIAALRRAVDLNPLAPRILDNLAAELGFAGRYVEAWEIIERANALQPDSSQIQCYRVRLLADLGRRDEALALARQMTANPNPEERGFRLLEAARVFALFGMKAEADAAAAQIPARDAERAILLAYLGEPRKAIPLLDRLSFGWIEDLLWGSGFDPIRSDPGYVAYLARTGLTESNTRAQAWRAAHPGGKTK